MKNINVFVKKNANQTTKINTKNKVTYISFPALDKYKNICNGFSTRLGGKSKGYLESMNLGFDRGDDKETVIENFRIFSQAVGFDMNNIVKGQQTHTTNIHIAGKNDCGRCFTEKDFLKDVDGIITNEAGIVLVASFADCVPLYFYDPVKKVVGMSHSGWRGTVGYMGRSTIEAMEEAYGCDPQDIIACIGPSICKDCYEISEDVANAFRFAFPKEYYNEILEEKENSKYNLDLWRANEIVLLKSGVKKENIFTTDICTCCNSKTLFSHRASNGKRGNMIGFLSLVEED